MTDTVKERGTEVPSAEMTVAAVIDAVRASTEQLAVHRTTMHALLGAARERAEVGDFAVNDREDLADALNALRLRDWATLGDAGFSLTEDGQEQVKACVASSEAFRELREKLEQLVGQKFTEWGLERG